MAGLIRRDARTRFGVILLPYSVSFSQISNATAHAEKLGFDSVWISDHLQRQNTQTLECWSTISALAATTTKIRIGSLATCNSSRNPSLLARIVSTISNISNGRIDLAIGLGYDKTEHVANGFQFSSFEERIERLSETLQILNFLWNSSEVNFDGKYYKLRGATSNPKPKGIIRLWVAGRSKKVLEIASKYAYGANILPYSGTLDKRRMSSFGKIRLILAELDSLSSRRKRFGKSMYCGDGGVVIGKDERDYTKRVKKCARSEGLTAFQFEKKLGNLSTVHGTISECRSSVSAIRSLGFEEMMMIFPGWQSGDYTNMELFAKEFIGN